MQRYSKTKKFTFLKYWIDIISGVQASKVITNLPIMNLYFLYSKTVFSLIQCNNFQSYGLFDRYSFHWDKWEMTGYVIFCTTKKMSFNFNKIKTSSLRTGQHYLFNYCHIYWNCNLFYFVETKLRSNQCIRIIDNFLIQPQCPNKEDRFISLHSGYILFNCISSGYWITSRLSSIQKWKWNSCRYTAVTRFSFWYIDVTFDRRRSTYIKIAVRSIVVRWDTAYIV